MHLCRECEVLLWWRRSQCPSCRAPQPAVPMIMTLPRTTARLERLGVAALVAAVPAMGLADQALRWLVVSLQS